MINFAKTACLPTIETTIPGGSKSAIAKFPLRTSTPLRNNKHPVLEALQSIAETNWAEKTYFYESNARGLRSAGRWLIQCMETFL